MTEQHVADRRDKLNSQVAEIAGNYDVFEFIQGQTDCREGVPHKSGTESYDAGYQTEYAREQMMGAL